MHNAFIQGFGQKYAEYSPKQLVSFCSSLNSAGLKQEDIFKSVLGSLETAEYEGNAVRDLYAPLLLHFLHLGLEQLVPTWHDQVKAKFGEDLGAVLVEKLGRRQKIELVNLILANGQEKDTPYVRTLPVLYICFVVRSPASKH